MSDYSTDGNRQKLFSPIGGSWGTVLITFTYLVILALFLSFLLMLISNPLNNLSTIFNLFFASFLEGSILFILFLPLVLSIVIHKSFQKGLLIMAITFGLLFVVMFAILNSEERGYLVLGFMSIVPIALGITALGIVARSFFKIPSKIIKGAILITPLIIFIIIGAVYISGSQQPTEKFCSSLSTSGQLDCFYKLAILEKSYHYCTKLWGDSFTMIKCQNEVASMLEAEGKLDQTICAKETSLHEESACYWFLADKLSDESICNQIPDEQIRINCHSYFRAGKRIFS